MSLKYILQTLQFVWRSSRKWTILLLITQCLQAVLPLASLYLIKLIVDSVTDLNGQQQFEAILCYVAAFGGVQLLQAIIQNYQLLISETQQQLVADYMATVIIDKALSIDLSYYENANYHDTFHQAQNQAVYRPVQILRSLTDFLRAALLLLSIAGLLLFLHWSIAIILLVFALPIAGVKWYYSKKLYLWERRRTKLEREAFYIKNVLTTDNYAKEVRIFNIGPYLKQQFIGVRTALFGEKFRIGQERARAGVLAQSLEIIALTFVYGFVVWRGFQGTISIGDLVMYFQAFQKGQVAIQQALTAMVGVYNNRLFLNHLFELLKIESRLTQTATPSPLPPLAQAIRLENVHFQYPETTKAVLSEVSLSFQKGQVIALVGENGSGKTSLVKLLCRLYDPTKGNIFWDDLNIKTVQLALFRERISVIYQDFAKYQFNIDQNIRIGDLERPLSETKRHIAAEKSGALEIIEGFPKGFDQQLGRRFKGGTELSGGQWQKIALARAFYKDADLIILDEPSSSIDPLAEAAIFEHFRAIAKDKILILVTHRLYNLKMADNIVVLHSGQVAEQGTHLDLMAKQGLYTQMFEKQAAD